MGNQTKYTTGLQTNPVLANFDDGLSKLSHEKGRAMKEKHLEDILEKYSDLIEPGLTLLRRQPVMYGRRMDMLFEDKDKRKLVVELKAGLIKDEHIGQLICYQGMLLTVEDSMVRAMLIGTRVPPYIKKALDHYGISWREVKISHLKDFLSKAKDNELLATVTLGESETEATGSPLDESDKPTGPVAPASPGKSKPKNRPILWKENDGIVQRILGWADSKGYDIETTKWGTSLAILEDDQRLLTKFGISREFLYLNLEHINYTRPFQAGQKRNELFERLTARLPNANISHKARSGNGSAGIHLSNFENEKTLFAFYEVLDWMTEQITRANEKK